MRYISDMLFDIIMVAVNRELVKTSKPLFPYWLVYELHGRLTEGQSQRLIAAIADINIGLTLKCQKRWMLLSAYLDRENRVTVTTINNTIECFVYDRDYYPVKLFECEPYKEHRIFSNVIIDVI